MKSLRKNHRTADSAPCFLHIIEYDSSHDLRELRGNPININEPFPTNNPYVPDNPLALPLPHGPNGKSQNPSSLSYLEPSRRQG